MLSSLVTSSSERKHSKRSVLTVSCVCVCLHGRRISLRLPRLVTLALPRVRSNPVGNFPCLARSSAPGSTGVPSWATRQTRLSFRNTRRSRTCTIVRRLSCVSIPLVLVYDGVVIARSVFVSRR